MKIEIATSAGIVYTADARMVTLPAADGGSASSRITCRCSRASHRASSSCAPATARRVLAVGEGLVAVTSNHIGIVTDTAIAGRDARAPVRKHAPG
jgi:F0F1-type ATP synthase epsilon subunit